MNTSSLIYSKSYCYTIVRDSVTVTLSLKNKINNLKKEVNVTVTLSCMLVLHYIF